MVLPFFSIFFHISPYQQICGWRWYRQGCSYMIVSRRVGFWMDSQKQENKHWPCRLLASLPSITVSMHAWKPMWFFILSTCIMYWFNIVKRILPAVILFLTDNRGICFPMNPRDICDQFLCAIFERKDILKVTNCMPKWKLKTNRCCLYFLA